MRQRVRAGLVRRGERGRLVDDHRPPLRLPGGGRRGGVLRGVGVALLAQAVASQGSRRTEGLQGLRVFVLGVGRSASRARCKDGRDWEKETAVTSPHGAAPVTHNICRAEQYLVLQVNDS